MPEKSGEKHEGLDVMRGDVRIPFSVQHNEGSVEKPAWCDFLQIIHHGFTNPAALTYNTARGAVNQKQPVLGARRSSAEERKLSMEIKVLDVSFSEQGRVVHI